MSTNKLTGPDVCVYMHTALRKCCDSKITSAAYNLVHIICELKLPDTINPWIILGDLIADDLENELVKDPEWTIAKHIIKSSRLIEEFDKRIEEFRRLGRKEPQITHSVLYALQCTLYCFDDDDFKGLAGFLNEY